MRFFKKVFDSTKLSDIIHGIKSDLMQTIDELKTPENQVIPSEVKIGWTQQTTAGIGQIYNSGIQFAFVAANNDQCHQLLYCKDFLLDVAHATLHDRPVSLYGFAYNPTKQPKADFNNIRVLIANKDDNDFASRIPGMLDILNQVETILDLKLTVAQKVTNPSKDCKNGAFVLVGSKRWMEAPPMISLFTLLVRAGGSHKANTSILESIQAIIDRKVPAYQKEDNYLLEDALPAIKQILTIGYRPMFFMDIKKNYPAKIDVSDLHNDTGIVALAKKDTAPHVKFWTRKELSEKPTLEERRKAKLAAVAEAATSEAI